MKERWVGIVVLLPCQSEGRGVGYKGVSEEFRKVNFVFCGRQ